LLHELDADSIAEPRKKYAPFHKQLLEGLRQQASRIRNGRETD
jgi:hypothetical protein